MHSFFAASILSTVFSFFWKTSTSLIFSVYSLQPLSIPESTLYAYTAPIIRVSLGLMIGRLSPYSIASVKKLWLTTCLCGRPKDIFDTPNTVFNPSTVLIWRRAFNVSYTAFCSVEAVSVNVSIKTSSFN